jgi:hypothetical protein
LRQPYDYEVLEGRLEMREPTTLGEALLEMDYRAKYHADPDHTNAWLQGYRAAAAWDASQLRRILYGTDEPCPGCTVARTLSGNVTCAICHDTGRIKTPGLVERVDRAQRGDDDGVPLGYIGAIRREIGEAV